MTAEYIKKAGAFIKWLLPFILAMLFLFGCQSAPEKKQTVQSAQAAKAQGTQVEALLAGILPADEEEKEQLLREDGVYTGRDEVALYIHVYGKLPQNFITKKQADALGWESDRGNLKEVAPGMSIGGGRFGNYEKQLPEKDGRKWYECDIEYEGGYRGPKRIVYSNDGLIYYTEDHYKTFEQLY